MKKNLLLLIGIFISFGILNAQIGINTEQPQALFHIDAARDNTPAMTSSQIANDMVITNQGFLGLGTITPEVEVDVIGKIRMEHGSMSNVTGKVLTSNNLGYASWGTVPKIGIYGTWQIASSSTQTFSSYTEKRLSGTSSVTFKSQGMGITDNGNNTVTVEAGVYCFMPYCDLHNVYETGYFTVRNADDNSLVYSSLYFILCSGAATILNFADPTTMYVSFEPLYNSLTFYAKTPIQAKYTAKLTFMRL